MSGIRALHLKSLYLRTESLAVDVDDLSVEPGEFMAVMGESGSGKTDLLRLIAGLETPDDGDIYVGGVWTNKTPIGQRPVQLIFQGLALWPHYKAMDDQSYSSFSFPLRARR